LPTLFRKDTFKFEYYKTLEDLLSKASPPFYHLTRNALITPTEEVLNLDTIKMTFPQIVDLIYSLGKNVIIFENTFVHNNCHQEHKEYYHFPTGATCQYALKKKLIGVNLDFLVAEDNGSRVLLPPIYYALWKNKYSKKVGNYVINYTATSINPNSRARYAFDLLNYNVSADYIITPGRKDGNTKLIEHCDKYSRVGYVIYTKRNQEMEELASQIINVDTIPFAFYVIYKKKRPLNVTTIKKRKNTRDELLPFLRQNLS
jgi:hypothetical protein